MALTGALAQALPYATAVQAPSQPTGVSTQTVYKPTYYNAGTGQAAPYQAPLGTSTYNPPPSSGGSNPSNFQGNVGTIVNGMRWNGNGWDPSGPGSGPSQDEINKQISETYDASNNYLNQAEDQVNKDYPTVQQDINGQYDTSKGQLDTSNTSNINQFNQFTDQANYGHETALAAARRLYSELRQGYQQRFGGSTSAGDAANQLANVEQQRQEGQQNRGYQDTLTTLNNKKIDTDNQYQQGLQALMTQKNQALNQANRDFQNKLLQISQSRAANEQAKGQAKLQALQDLRNQVFQISQQNTQFQQALEAQRQASQLQLQNYQAMAGGNVGAAQAASTAYGQMAGQTPTSNLQAGGYNPQQQTQYIGAINQKKDQYGNPLP
jgi:hypothetical protein